MQRLAERVAFNRERAGLHYKSDSMAGKALAEHCLSLIKGPGGCPRILQLIADAQGEWARLPYKWPAPTS